MATVNPYESSQSPALAQLLPGGTGLIRDGDKLTIAFDVFVEDMVEFAVEHHRRSAAARRSFYVICFGLPAVVLILMMLAYVYRSDGNASGPIVALIGAIGFSLYYGLGYVSMLRKNAQRSYAQGSNASVCGPWRVEITPERLSVYMPLVDTHCRWAAVQRFERSASALHIYISSVSAIIIPLRAFRDSAEPDEVEQVVRSRMTASQPQA